MTDVRRSTLTAGFLLVLVGVSVSARQDGGLSLADAVRTTLAEQPLVHVAREQVRFNQATLQAVSGRFDWRVGGSADQSRTSSPLRDRDRQGGLFDNLTSHQTNLLFGVDLPLRSGLIISPHLGLTRQDIDLDRPAQSRTSLALGLTQPLLRGRGETVVTAEENAARLEVGASSQDLRHTASQSVLRTAAAYWDYVAAARTRDVVIASEDRARRLLDETRVLIEGGNRPAADLKQVQGNLAERLALRATVENQYFAARQALGLAMGIPTERIAALPAPADDFPPIAALAPLSPDLVAGAVSARADAQSTELRSRATDALIVAARDALKPQLDLNVTLGYAGLAEGGGISPLVTAFERRFTGPNATASFTYSKSPANNTAAGLLARSEAINRQTRLQLDELGRTIRANVAVAYDDLIRSAERVQLLREAADLYVSAVEDERQKLQLGLATVIDLVLVEDRLTRSRIDEIAALQSYARALARLRFETGTLVAPGPSMDFTVAPQALTTVPVAPGQD